MAFDISLLLFPSVKENWPFFLVVLYDSFWYLPLMRRGFFFVCLFGLVWFNLLLWQWNQHPQLHPKAQDLLHQKAVGCKLGPLWNGVTFCFWMAILLSWHHLTTRNCHVAKTSTFRLWQPTEVAAIYVAASVFWLLKGSGRTNLETKITRYLTSSLFKSWMEKYVEAFYLLLKCCLEP